MKMCIFLLFSLLLGGNVTVENQDRIYQRFRNSFKKKDFFKKKNGLKVHQDEKFILNQNDITYLLNYISQLENINDLIINDLDSTKNLSNDYINRMKFYQRIESSIDFLKKYMQQLNPPLIFFQEHLQTGLYIYYFLNYLIEFEPENIHCMIEFMQKVAILEFMKFKQKIHEFQVLFISKNEKKLAKYPEIQLDIKIHYESLNRFYHECSSEIQIPKNQVTEYNSGIRHLLNLCINTVTKLCTKNNTNVNSFRLKSQLICPQFHHFLQFSVKLSNYTLIIRENLQYSMSENFNMIGDFIMLDMLKN